MSPQNIAPVTGLTDVSGSGLRFTIGGGGFDQYTDICLNGAKSRNLINRTCK
jgi:hypothetical protein